MKLIIDIPEEVYDDIKEGYYYEYVRTMAIAIKNGTPLPKGHGDLKDADSLKHAFIKWSMAVQGNFSNADIASIICHSPTIIEAEESEET